MGQFFATGLGTPAGSGNTCDGDLCESKADMLHTLAQRLALEAERVAEIILLENQCQMERWRSVLCREDRRAGRIGRVMSAAAAPSRAVGARIGAKRLEGLLAMPEGAPIGLVIFGHGSGSSRFSPRNAYAAERLSARGCATLLFDLLTQSESADRRNVFDIPLMAARVAEAIAWARAEPSIAHLPIGLFGASTGAAAAIVAAASCRKDVAAVVSRGGRPDLAGWALEAIEAPTLLIVGGEDREVLELNRAALARMRCPSKLVIVPGATHLFEEEGALDLAIDAAGDWFASHLGQAPHDAAAVS
jgi:putative phosphoribosyl transferase